MRKSNQRVIHLDDMLCYILGKWKLFLIGCILVGIIFGGIGIYKIQKKYASNLKSDNKVEVNISGTDLDNVEAVLTLERAIKNQREYNENSILMNIDPNNKILCSLKYQICVSNSIDPQLRTSKLDQGKKAYQNILFDDRLYESIKNELQTDIDTKYLRELIYCETDAVGVIVYNITADSEEMARDMSNAIKRFLFEHNKEILGNYDGLSSIVDSEVFATLVDLGLQGTQTTNHANLQNLTTTLDTRLIAMSDNAKQYLQLSREAIEKGNYKFGQPLYKKMSGVGNVSGSRKLYEAALYAIKRVILFAVFLLVCLAIKYMCSRTLVCANDLEDMYGVHVIDTIISNEKEKIKIISEKISLLAGHSDKVVISGSNIRDDVNNELLNDIKYALNHKGIDVEVVDDFFSLKTFELLKDNTNIMLIERVGNSTYNSMDNLINNLLDFEIKILGAVVVK